MEKLNQVTHQIEGLLLMLQVKNINKLWDLIVESKNKNGHKKFDDIIKHLENTAINTLVQTQKIQNVNIELNENDISKELKQNLSKEDICVKGWINAFLPQKSMQIFNNKFTQTNIGSEANKKSTETQTDAQIVKSSENYKANKSSNIETNISYQKLSKKIESDKSNSSCKVQKIISHGKESTHTNQEYKQNAQKKLFNFNSSKREPNINNYSASLQRRKWKEKQNKAKDSNDDRSWISNDKNKNQLRSDTAYTTKYRYADQAKNGANHHHQHHHENGIYNNISALFTSLLIKWMETNIQMDQNYYAYNNYYSYNRQFIRQKNWKKHKHFI